MMVSKGLVYLMIPNWAPQAGIPVMRPKRFCPNILFVPETISVLKSKHRIYGPVKYHSWSPTHQFPPPIPTYPLSLFLTLAQCLTGNSPMTFKRTMWAWWNLCIRLRVFICAFSPVFLSSSCWLIIRYEWFISLDFEWDFISGKKRLRWPMVSSATLPNWMQ